MKELNTKYNHLEIEDGKYEGWIKEGYFTAGDKAKDPFTIVIPPPNVTGKLHLGHAWDNTLQDIIARFKRMQGFDMLYLPGMDHAGIATQAKVDARLKSEGLSRYDLGRDKFLDRAWEWKEEYAKTIRTQWAKLGNSLDYSRERFTLDEGLNTAVKKVFCDLYNAGLIYQGERIINWDPKACTALSNIEVIHKEITGHFYTFKYQVVDSNETFNVATTRPETMFGDVCVVVHPDDENLKHLIGKKCINPANQEIIPIIADDYIEIGFGTGAMKCTPAHDPNDFQIAERHNLAKIKCMNPDGTMNEVAGKYQGQDRFECRKNLVKEIEQQGNLVSIEEHIHQVGHSERTDVIVEPYLSKQWFVKMKPLAQDVLAHQDDAQEKINFYPERFEKTFTRWLENIEDWCISRQLWWGHQIPAWYHNDTNEIYVGTEAPKDIENWHQDEDVLDTWFSSALWPFSTLGWPENTSDLARYYPTSTMVTGYDIIFFWVARMAFQARYFTKKSPFKDCLIHGLIRDSQGRKMSKSLGNGIDPMDVIEKYGVDSLRFFLSTNSTPGQDMRYMEDKVEASWNFINKIWNATRFTMMNLSNDFSFASCDFSNLSSIDVWMLNRLNQTVESVTTNMEKYEFALAGNELYNFIWNDFCSSYIEMSKANLQCDDATKVLNTQSTLYYTLQTIIKLLHPFMPFVTEELYLALVNDGPCCHAAWPTKFENLDLKYVERVDQLLEIIKVIRETKAENNIKPSAVIRIMIKDENNDIYYNENLEPILQMMTKAKWLLDLSGDLTVKPITKATLYIPTDEISNLEEELLQLEKDLKRLTNEITRGEKMLSNENFLKKAAPEKVESEKNKLENYKIQFETVNSRIIEIKQK